MSCAYPLSKLIKTVIYAYHTGITNGKIGKEDPVDTGLMDGYGR